jgi:iron complex transport system ATP-binding protein
VSTLALEGVSVRLGGRAVLQELSCALAAGEMLGIIGPNGAGKSTLLRVMAGLLRPDAGQVRLQGRELQSWPAAERARRIGYLP